jgi:hypothetical protein
LDLPLPLGANRIGVGASVTPLLPPGKSEVAAIEHRD